MSQHDMSIEDGTGLSVRENINNALLALTTLQSGSIEPEITYPGQLWLDTALGDDGILRMRNLLNTLWIKPTIDSGFKDYTKTASGAWTKPANLKKLEVFLVGAGGGAGGSPATAAGQSSAGGGGGAGGVTYGVYLDVSTLPASVNFSVGAGGTAGNGTGTAGTAGGNTTFNNLTALGGGGGGQVGPVGTFGAANGGAGGGATSTEGAGCLTRLWPGGQGVQGLVAAHGVAAAVGLGAGGSNFFASARPGNVFIGSSGLASLAGSLPGGGASGAANSASQAARAGAAGAAGIIYMREYF